MRPNGNKTSRPTVYRHGESPLRPTLQRLVGWFVVLQGILFAVLIIAVLGGADSGLRAPAAILWLIVGGFLPIVTSLVATRAPRIAARIDLWIVPITPLLALTWRHQYGGVLIGCIAFSGAIVVPACFWLLTSRRAWPPLLQISPARNRPGPAFAVGSGLFCFFVALGILSSLFLPWWPPLGDCSGRSLLTKQGVPAGVDFTAKIVFVAPRSFNGWSLWSVAHVEQRFAGLPSWWPNLIILQGYFRPSDKLSHYFVEGRRSEAAITRFLPVIKPVECGHTARLEEATIAVRVLRDGPPSSGVRIIGGVYKRMGERRIPVTGIKVVITGPHGSIASTTDEQGIYDVIASMPGQYKVQIVGNDRAGVYAPELREHEVYDDTFYVN